MKYLFFKALMHLSLAEINSNKGATTKETKEKKKNISTTYFLSL